VADLIRRPQISYADTAPFDPERQELPRAVKQQVEIVLKYEGYIKRQLKQVEEFTRLEEKRLPADIDYDQVVGLRLEAREKLKKIRPENFGQAGRISGVSPADVSVLMIYVESRK
jgi:tRNA uridine 5-carboxymethylaminomethyl modification enzyme